MKKYIVLMLAAACCVTAATTVVPPNIVYLMADDQSSFTLGCYGNSDVKTPNIDRLAEDGMAFDNHYDTTAICMASRAEV